MTSPRAAGGRPSFDHLVHLTDERGLFEHARHSTPRTEHGYCLDDAARALLVLCREPYLRPPLVRLADGYLRFVESAMQPDGSCHNRMDAGGSFTDVPDVGDWWGRALWGLGVAAVHAPTAGMRARAVLAFRRGAAQWSPHLRATAFAALGAAELVLARPGEAQARLLLRECVERIPDVDADSVWAWPETRMSYGNGSLVEALLAAGEALPDPDALARGCRLLDFLLTAESRDGHLSVTPVGGRGPDGATDRFDQQPIEVAALADACARAYRVSGQARYVDGVRMAWAWFLGDNDSSTLMFNPPPAVVSTDYIPGALT